MRWRKCTLNYISRNYSVSIANAVMIGCATGIYLTVRPKKNIHFKEIKTTRGKTLVLSCRCFHEVENGHLSLLVDYNCFLNLLRNSFSHRILVTNKVTRTVTVENMKMSKFSWNLPSVAQR